ncbi:hypothetical protein P168DRAFT_321437 [Aspergillus campestris IBT 28561]|uniref:Phosphoglycerate mutase family protein n=1 Tax=Aspergillus campestris (strain IBT 28561) TaxID=1392248 RepID=A0A2I1CTP8_ASPC2|nr:uncharacterized protein P168DRAFT_321437 [Aspergillus campestris IBT 28561]PKY01006.1 hypothetical protein P168DRAFT_321437 [Aspergillus campestris IBT 28561]
MGKPPAAIIVARHGARLDAADKDWHLTSPTPYDPPLSYGGWMQSRALGARIVNLVHSMESDPQPPRARPLNRKFRIVIHSSPYLRCLQTAIALSSGICQNSPAGDSPQRPSPAPQSGPVNGCLSPTPTDSGSRCVLRVDACLGEWLCPDYFDHIVPPPSSERMVTAAKAELLRREHQFVPDADINARPTTGHFPGGWTDRVSPTTSAPPADGRFAQGEPATTPAPSQAPRQRAESVGTSLSSEDSPGHRRWLTINTDLAPIPDSAYVPPTPSYAISPSGPIPPGYVTHARDACVQVDYPWDSMRNSQNWGDGGEFGEDWSAMHARFRGSLEHINAWYRDHERPAPRAPRRRRTQLPGDAEDGTVEEEVETVVVLVTHGAGCNALVGALSGQPALVDIGTASLTMAVREDRDRASGAGDARSSWGLDDYNLELVASTDHLRSAPPSASVLSSPTSVVAPSGRFRSASRTSPPPKPFVVGPTATSGLGSTSRPWSLDRPSTAPRGGSSGLWGSMAATAREEDDLFPNFGGAFSGSSLTLGGPRVIAPVAEEESAKPKQLPQRTLSQRGLWGGAPLNKDMAVKRRWTVTERRA